MLARSWGWPRSRTASGLAEPSWALVSIRIASSWSWDSRCASPVSRTGSRPRSASAGAQGRHDRVVDAPGADLRVGDGDELVAGGIQAGDSGPRGHGLARADLTGDHRDLAGIDAVGDPADGFLMRCRGEQRPDRDGPVEGQPLEPEVAAHGVIDHHWPPGGLGARRLPGRGWRS